MGLIDTFKDIIQVVQKADNVELYKMIMEAQQGVWELQNENRDLKDENTELQRTLAKKKNMIYDSKNGYFVEIKEDGKEEGKFCPKCWQKDDKAVYLETYRHDLKCTVCGNVVGDKNHQASMKAIMEMNSMQ